MKKTRFSEEQMVTILREADQRPVPEVTDTTHLVRYLIQGRQSLREMFPRTIPSGSAL